MISPARHIERWRFYPKLLFLARRARLKVKEVPVRWGHDTGMRIHPFRDGFPMFVEIFSIRWTDMRGEYPVAASQTAKILPRNRAGPAEGCCRNALGNGPS
jgi:hypothetical protein